MNEQTALIVKKISDLPPLSASTLAIINMLSADHFHMKELVNLIQQDVSLSTLCLKTVNSAAFGLSKPVDTIQRAVTFLGSQKLTELALKTSVGKIVKVRLAGYGAMEMDLWEHSLKSAIAARLIGPNIDPNLNADLAYALALTHDIGKVVFSALLEVKVRELQKAQGQQTNFLAIESDLFQCNHAEVGAMLAREWNLPQVFIDVIAHHHTPSLCPAPHRSLALVVHLADLLAMLSGTGTGVDSLYYELDPLALDLIERDARWHEEEIWKLILNLNYEFNLVLQNEAMAS